MGGGGAGEEEEVNLPFNVVADTENAISALWATGLSTANAICVMCHHLLTKRFVITNHE